MLAQIDNPQDRFKLVKVIKVRIECEIENIAALLCEEKDAVSALRRLRTMTYLLTKLEFVTIP